MGGLILLGLVCLGIAYIWSGMMAADLSQANLVTQLKTWPAWFPIIKNRWTSTFALYAAGWSNLLLALFYLVIDVWKIRFWAFPFVVIGANSIFAYMCWQLGNSVFRSAANIFLGGLKPYVGPDWFEAISWAGATALLWLLLWYLYRNRTFIRA
jgi:predicted acyltransferase